ncbi:hypothetical protein V2J09_018714 [Rumex salicifolius]
MEASRQRLQSYKATSTHQGIKRPILEEFIPMKHSNSEDPPDQQKAPNSTSDKASWMTSAQLWSQANEETTNKQLELLSSKDLEMGFSPKLSLLDHNNESNKGQGNCGAFLPFTKEKNNTLNPAISDLALVLDDQRNMDVKSANESGLMSSESLAKVSNGGGSAAADATTNQTHRKQRRCWSPELHRRFVNALQMLGGSQVATPKQIRELMKVDGLTNDEVKSHLQKYRLHTRRPGPSPQGPGSAGPQLVVLGGIWVPPEYATAAHHHHTIYTAQPTAQVGPHYCPPPGIPQEFYPPPLPPPPLHHNQRRQVQLYKASTSQGHSSHDSHAGRGERDQSESIEDGKSESSSGDQDCNINERKKLADEESHGSDVILRF